MGPPNEQYMPHPEARTEIYRLGANGPSLSSAIAEAEGSKRRLALLHIDVDGLGEINANMGESAVDQVIEAIAKRLIQTMPGHAWLWYSGSEQFLVAVAYRDDEPDGTVIAEYLRDAFIEPISAPPYKLVVSLSIGIAVYPQHAQDASRLLAAAGQALRKAMRDSDSEQHIHVCDAASENENEVSATRRNLERRFSEAIAQQEFRLYYQPVVSAQDGSIVSCSSLLRWHNDVGGVLRANRILPAMAQAGLAREMGIWTIETALQQLRDWRELGIDYLTISIPLDGALLCGSDCLDLIGELLHRHDIPGTAIEFEVSESILAMDSAHVAGNLAQLHRAGTLLTLADFGMHGMNLAALASYPLDRLKIDRSFLRYVTTNPRSAALLHGMIAMGHHLGMKLVAKGVETDASLRFLRRHHCDFFQGYLFSAPLPGTDIDEVLRHRFLHTQAFHGEADDAQPMRTLLLLDDEENVLRSLVRLLRRDGYRVLSASSVSEAFDLLARNDVQVVLSDQRMPDMSGTEFLARVRDLYPHTIRLALSGYTDLETISEAINQDAACRFLIKPWSDDDLREHIRAAFRMADQQHTQ